MPFPRVFLSLILFIVPAPAQIPDALTALNDGFRQAYADARKRILAADGPLIIVNGDTAALIQGGHRSEAAINVPQYHLVKTIAHIPLAVYVALTPGEGPIDADRLQTLEKLRGLIPPARAALAGLGFTEPVIARQDRIVEYSLAFLDGAIGRREYTRKGLEAFTRREAPLVMANAADATKAQLDALHAQVTAWRHEMTPKEWDALHVLVIAAHMPRDGSLHVQYFARLLHEPIEGRRIVVAESLWEEPKALDLYGTHLLDSGIGEAFFGDPMRMHRDLLADAAKEYLKKILP